MISTKIVSMLLMKINYKYKSSEFQLVVGGLNFLQWASVVGLIFNSDGCSSSSLKPLYNHLIQTGFLFSQRLYNALHSAAVYTTDLYRFISKGWLNKLDIVAAKYEVMPTLYPQLYKYTNDFKFSNKLNKPLLLSE